MSTSAFSAALQQRIDCLEDLSQGQGVDTSQMYNAIDALRKGNKTVD
jgi:hypothetical protein